MINVLLRHDHTVRDIASAIVIHRYQNNDKDAFYLFFNPLTASVIEPFINLARHSRTLIQKNRTQAHAGADTQIKYTQLRPRIPHRPLNYIPSLGLLF